MSCSQIALECTSSRYALVYNHPSAFYMWRYAFIRQGTCFAFYRCMFAFIFLALVILDYVCIIQFGAVRPLDSISAILDASQWAILAASICYCALAINTVRWVRGNWDSTNENAFPYKCLWLFYTISLNAVFSTMVIYWMFYNITSPLEQILKHSIPGCLILIDLIFNGIPLYLCHAFYPAILYLIYLGIATLGIYLNYVTGRWNPNLDYSQLPTVWIGGYPLLPGGYKDFYNIPRIFLIIAGVICLSIIIHCFLLTLVITRDFLSSLCEQSTEIRIEDDNYYDSTVNLLNRHDSSNLSTTSSSTTSQQQIQNTKMPIYATNQTTFNNETEKQYQ